LIRFKTKFKASDKTKKIKDKKRRNKINAIKNIKAKTIFEVRGGKVLISIIFSIDVKTPVPTLLHAAALKKYLLSGNKDFISKITLF